MSPVEPPVTSDDSADRPPRDQGRRVSPITLLFALGLALALAGVAARWMPALEAGLAGLLAPTWAVPDYDDAGMAPNVREVLDDARAELSRNPRNPRGWFEYAALLHAHALDEPAMAAYRRAGRLQPDDPRVPYLLAVLGPSTGMDAEVRLALFQHAATMDPHYPPTWLRMGELLADEGRADEALRALRRAVELDPSYPMAHRQLGLTLLETGDLGDALLHLRFASELVEDDYPTWAGLARALQRAGRDEEAAQAAARSEPLVEVMSYRDGVLDGILARGVGPLRMDALAANYAGRGAWREALEALKMVERARPDDADVQRRLSEVYEALDEAVLAAVHRRRAAALEESAR